MTWNQEQMCKITAELEIRDGFYVNLGIGMPTLVANYISPELTVTFQSENGMLGMGAFPTKETVDADLINAGKQTISELSYSSYFDSAFSFAMIRGGHIDLSILGALQVSEHGDLANWMIPGKMVKGMGGAMDLVAGVKRVVVLMEHNSKDGDLKILKHCSFPLTGKRVVDRIVTNIAIFDIDKHNHNSGLELIAMSKDVSLEKIQERTEPDFKISNNLRII
jgi:3-oxoacid CoA-transferase subunit B